MNIDKSKLKIGIWYEDSEGNMYKPDYAGNRPKDVDVKTYNTSFPSEVTTTTSFVNENKDTCRHPLRFRKRTTGWVKGIKGCECTRCKKTKTGKSYIPFAFMKWSNAPDFIGHFTSSVTLGKFSQDCIVAMVNSGDYEFNEAMVVMASACERCMNVLLYKYLDGKDGYLEYSDEWKKAGTVCDFCRNN